MKDSKWVVVKRTSFDWIRTKHQTIPRPMLVSSYGWNPDAMTSSALAATAQP